MALGMFGMRGEVWSDHFQIPILEKGFPWGRLRAAWLSVFCGDVLSIVLEIATGMGCHKANIILV